MDIESPLYLGHSDTVLRTCEIGNNYVKRRGCTAGDSNTDFPHISSSCKKHHARS